MLRKDKVALATGSGTEIGKALAFALAREGAIVVVDGVDIPNPQYLAGGGMSKQAGSL